MEDQLSYRDIESRLKEAFKPQRCVVEPWDYGHRIRFAVFDKAGRQLAEMPDIILNDVRDPQSLEVVIELARDQIRRNASKIGEPRRES